MDIRVDRVPASPCPFVSVYGAVRLWIICIGVHSLRGVAAIWWIIRQVALVRALRQEVFRHSSPRIGREPNTQHDLGGGIVVLLNQRARILELEDMRVGAWRLVLLF